MKYLIVLLLCIVVPIYGMNVPSARICADNARIVSHYGGLNRIETAEIDYRMLGYIDPEAQDAILAICVVIMIYCAVQMDWI